MVYRSPGIDSPVIPVSGRKYGFDGNPDAHTLLTKGLAGAP
jgi:hypothetical protein